MKRLIAFDAMHSRSFRVRVAMGRSSRPRASNQRPIARAACVVTCACHSSGLTGSTRLGHQQVWPLLQMPQADRWIDLTRPTKQVSKRCWRAAIAPKPAMRILALQLQGVDGLTAAPGPVPLP